ncbi:MAG: 5'-methylthioadenosine/S-adenosylhomocysteine nucleosidase [Pseudomonadota bacterium]
MIIRTILAAAISMVASGAIASGLLDDTPRTAILSAFEPEWVELKDELSDRQEFTENGVVFVTGELQGEDVVLFLSGIGMVNAAMTTQLALDRFNVSAIVVSGIAGGVDPGLSIGDVVVADRWAQYLFVVLARRTPDGFSVPPLFGKPFPNFDMMFPQLTTVRRDGAPEGRKMFWFDTDPGLMEAAKTAAAAITLKRCASADNCLTEAPEIRIGGAGVSGSAFVDNADFRRYVFDTFNAQLLDMETAAVAHVAFSNGTPFIAFRALSDLAGGGEGENEIGTFFAVASSNSAAVVRAFLKARSDEGARN